MIDKTFEQWLGELDVLASAEGYNGSYTQQTGEDCWVDAYNDDVTPAEAWAEEKSYAADSLDAE